MAGNCPLYTVIEVYVGKKTQNRNFFLGEQVSQVDIRVTFVGVIIYFCPQGFFGEREDYLLFASLFEITMMDPSVGTRPVTFELSIGEQSATCHSCYCRDAFALGFMLKTLSAGRELWEGR